MTEPRRLVLHLPEPPSVNRLLRMHHRERSKLRDALVLHVRTQRPLGWVRMERVRLDAQLRLHNWRDPLELSACLKVHVDAIRRAGIFVDDGPRFLLPGEITQRIDRKNRGCTITVTEIPREEAA